MKLLLAAAALGLLLLSPRFALACSCLGTPTVCEAFGGAEAVFVGSVTRVRNKMAKDEDGKEFLESQVANVQVEEAFKGVKAPELLFRTYGTSCDVTYEEGQRLLFYASYSKEDKAWSVGMCGRSTLVEHAANDLSFLRGLPSSAQRTRISGELKTRDHKPLMGIKVKLVGKDKTYEVFSDTNGIYEVYDLPAGKYVIAPETHLNLKLKLAIGEVTADSRDRNRPMIELKEKSCAAMDFYFTESTVIRGRVLGADGQPMHNVCLRLLRKEKPAERLSLVDCTARDGRFEIDEISIGEYYLVANDDGVISSDEPFPLTYYPGVFEKQKATVLNIATGDKLEDVDIHIPSQRPTRTIEGRLLFSDGRPAEGQSVQFTSEENPGRTSDVARGRTDAEGRFKLTVLEGSKGTLHSRLYTIPLDTYKCPEIDKLAKAYKDIETNRLKVEMNRDHQDIELAFTVPYCAKKPEKPE